MNVVIVEDSELVSSQIRRALSQESRIHLLGVATDEASAIALIRSSNPDAVLLDLCLSPGSGITVLRKMRESQIGSRVFVLTNNTEDAIRVQCEALGISGFFDKSAAADECFRKLYALLPALPANETSRLQALYETRLLDSPEQEAFDAIARLARDITNTSIALVSLVDSDRQWFLSHQGIENRETSRSIAVCAHTIQGSELLEIQDLTQDTRFFDNPLVVGAPHIRFYAGVPLIVPSGQVLGTLCVLDTVSRRLTDQQSSALKTLALSVVAEMELRRKVRGLEFEVERRRVAEDRVLDLATRDMLTQLPNCMALHDRLGQQLRQAARDGSKFAFLFIDLDRFKRINDSLGHEAGDLALIEIAQRIRSTLRLSDTVARLGGDEFAAILGNIRDESDALALAQKVNLALKHEAVLCGTELHYDASIGIAVFSDDADNVHDLIHKADLAMYQAKREGGGRSVLFTPALETKALQLLSLETELEMALRRDEIIAHYQPQIALDGKGISGVEALARWQHPRQGLLEPSEFIPFAESRQIIHRIGFRMIDLALGQLALWDQQGINIPVVAVNVSQSEIKQGLLEVIQSALVRHKIAAHRLEIEITESVLLTDRTRAILVLQQLGELGVRISVDDFGSGNSSLGQLLRLPVDALKIDRSFVSEIPGNKRDCAIIAAISNMARALGLHIVAAGAERADQVALLSAMGCHSVQGLFYTAPLAPHYFGLWCRNFLEQNKAQPDRARMAVLAEGP
jgi:diguanylate cyclase (GGDEF)-like protein